MAPAEHDLSRFLSAQEPVIADVFEELRRGRKTSHWMWFVFPQIDGLGRSPTARFYAIHSLGEAEAYVRHAVLGERIRHATELVLAVQERSAHAIFGSPDDLKFHSSMTLFERAAPDPALFRAALDRFHGGRPDQATLDLL